MSLSSFFSSFLPVVHADAPEENQIKGEQEQKEEEPTEEAEAAEEPEEEEEPEDIHPAIREECQETAKCAPLTKHFQHCQEKVSAGEGYKGEDCVEELMMHCVDACAAPKLFSKLR
ncbi:subunit 6 of the ubiquinol cytochrome-c reductase complex, QCR6 [Serpula lacrymans var. lacrymans S7.9]|uniref:Subunit 6 of the ubiquinol cytochrome-c reductase complex, QCR6 n=1 Tax=Serpula lacrymans var. lacrymans (strain S7.9) TaxID=578457 RepID=F8P9J2_SERL9|nr:subunit 6 of the ubiquinol cytochrome-c reductase complex, QCR6 [Serpula lacrymans var. lacrymans S7.9]EGO20321.1 subunit 6 of the ubiquinol cytochrome-c reductase complex, QCR6 [Serpula lacrymans var. lacrymans S7.9]